MAKLSMDYFIDLAYLMLILLSLLSLDKGQRKNFLLNCPEELREWLGFLF
jgi:hypothetical protein